MRRRRLYVPGSDQRATMTDSLFSASFGQGVDDKSANCAGVQFSASFGKAADPIPASDGSEAAGDPSDTDLAAFYSYAWSEPLVQGSFTKVKSIADAFHGKVELHRWRREGRDDEPCIVKKMFNDRVGCNLGKESNERRAHLLRPDDPSAPCHEDALTEIGVLSYLLKQGDQPRFLIRMLGAFRDSTHTWLVTEHCDGGDVFTMVASGGSIPEEQMA